MSYELGRNCSWGLSREFKRRKSSAAKLLANRFPTTPLSMLQGKSLILKLVWLSQKKRVSAFAVHPSSRYRGRHPLKGEGYLKPLTVSQNSSSGTERFAQLTWNGYHDFCQWFVNTAYRIGYETRIWLSLNHQLGTSQHSLGDPWSAFSPSTSTECAEDHITELIFTRKSPKANPRDHPTFLWIERIDGGVHWRIVAC